MSSSNTIHIPSFFLSFIYPTLIYNLKIFKLFIKHTFSGISIQVTEKMVVSVKLYKYFIWVNTISLIKFRLQVFCLSVYLFWNFMSVFGFPSYSPLLGCSQRLLMRHPSLTEMVQGTELYLTSSNRSRRGTLKALILSLLFAWYAFH